MFQIEPGCKFIWSKPRIDIFHPNPNPYLQINPNSKKIQQCSQSQNSQKHKHIFNIANV